MPGYAGDYADFPSDFKTPEMQDPDQIAKKFLAMTFAHAVQETSDSGVKSRPGDFMDKIPGTFASIYEDNKPPLPDASGPFSSAGKMYALAKGKNYCGRGPKQLSYPTNYSNVSLLLYGDLRLVAYPELIEEPCCLAFLTAIAYALIPKESNPSIAEVMDGSWHMRLNGPANNTTPQFVQTYDRGFPLTVLIVNGGPEGNHNTKNLGNAKVPIDAYNYFSTDEKLLDTSVKYAVKNSGEGYDSILDMEINTINDIKSNNAWQKMFARPYYYSAEGVHTWSSDIQIFGGAGVKDIAL
jgi:Chitinase class I